MIAVVDYGAGNVQSVVNAFQTIGAPVTLTADPAVVGEAQGVVVPGVGEARAIMRGLEEAGLVRSILDVIDAGTPYLGICMGMQVLMTWSEEHGGQACLDVVAGPVREIKVDLAIPHMGWNGVFRTEANSTHPLFRRIPQGAEFYFAHSYACYPDDPSWLLAWTEYGEEIPCAVARDNLMGVQFHPEKSGQYGLQLLRNFVDIVEAGGVGAAAEQRARALA